MQPLFYGTHYFGILKFDAQGNLTGSSTTSSAVLNEINHYAIGNK